MSRRRVYEYVADDGTVFYSFKKMPYMVSPPLRLILKSRIGRHLINHLVDMRRAGEELDEQGVDEYGTGRGDT